MLSASGQFLYLPNPTLLLTKRWDVLTYFARPQNAVCILFIVSRESAILGYAGHRYHVHVSEIQRVCIRGDKGTWILIGHFNCITHQFSGAPPTGSFLSRQIHQRPLVFLTTGYKKTLTAWSRMWRCMCGETADTTNSSISYHHVVLYSCWHIGYFGRSW